jgi:hypothetical protein
MEYNSPFSLASRVQPADPCDLQFQVSLLRLVYPGATISTQTAQLETMTETVPVLGSRH